jgi:hypothetical protein
MRVPELDQNNTNNNNSNSTNGSAIRGQTESTLDLFDINVKQAESDVDSVFKYAESKFNNFSKKRNDSFSSMISTYKKSVSSMYDDLRDLHSSYMSDIVSSETGTAGKVSDIWSSASSAWSDTVSNNASKSADKTYQYHKSSVDRMSDRYNKYAESVINDEKHASERINSIRDKDASQESSRTKRRMSEEDKFYANREKYIKSQNIKQARESNSSASNGKFKFGFNENELEKILSSRKVNINSDKFSRTGTYTSRADKEKIKFNYQDTVSGSEYKKINDYFKNIAGNSNYKTANSKGSKPPLDEIHTNNINGRVSQRILHSTDKSYNTYSYDKNTGNIDTTKTQKEFNSWKQVIDYAKDSFKGERDDVGILFEKTSNSLKSLSESLKWQAENKYGSEGSDPNTGKSVGLTVASAVTSSLSKGVDIFLGRFESGLNRIINTYEATYRNVSTMMSWDSNQYIAWQNKTTDTINNSGLGSSIAISDVMNELNNVTSNGIVGSSAQNIALQNTITKAVSPFVDTSTSAYMDLQAKYGDKFVNSTSGIISSLDTNIGESRYISKNINQIISQLEPVSRNASAELSSKMLEQYSSAFEQMKKNGATDSEVSGVQKILTDIQTNPYEALTSGNTYEKVLASKVASGQISKNDVPGLLSSLQDMMKQYNTNNGTYTGEITNGATQNALGTPEFDQFKNNLWNNVVDKTNGSTGTSITAFDKLFSNLKNGNTTTAEQKLKNGAENGASEKAAAFYEQYPDAFKLFQTMSGQLTGIQNAIIGTGIANTGSNLLSGLGKGGKISDAAKNIFSRFSKAENVEKAAQSAEEATEAGSKVGGKSIGLVQKLGARLGQFGDKAGDFLHFANGGAKAVEEANDAGQTLSHAAQIGTKAGGIASHLGGPLAALGFAIDGVQGLSKSNDWFGSKGNNVGNKVSSFFGSAIGGTGSGVMSNESGTKKASDIAFNALKGAGAGAAIGSVIPGLGTVVGGVIGAAGGAITAAIGGENISKFFSDTGNKIASAFGSVADWGKKTWTSVSTATSKGWSVFTGNLYDRFTGKANFWTGKSNTETKNSHAAGLTSVPYNGYVASLHKGEAIYNATAATAVKKVTGISATAKPVVSESSVNSIASMTSGDVSDGKVYNTSDASVVNAIAELATRLEKAIGSISSSGLGTSSLYKNPISSLLNSTSNISNYNKNIVGLVSEMP